MAKHSQSKERMALRTQENLTPKMKMIRDRYIAEYLVDFNGPKAYIRAGGPATTAAKMSSQFNHEPYVLKKIQECIDSLEEAEIINRKRVLAGLVREANYSGIGASHGARVAAYGTLSKILNMQQTNINLKGDIKVRGGIMVVPVASPEDWEKLAQVSQKQLKDDVRK
jgi:hypothetical protein